MELNLRQAIILRVQDKSQEELLDIIEGSIGSEERSLPGLGVLFEMIWKESDENTQNQLASALKTHLETHFNPNAAVQQ
jgi:small acid-soluble spore protein I (minor)